VVLSLAKNMFKKYRGLILYGLVGATALVIELSLYYVLSQEAGLIIPLANAIAMSAGLIISFSLNARYNFYATDSIISRFLKFSLVTFFGYLLSTALILTLISFGFSSILAKLLTLPPLFIFQYNFNRIFTFKKHEESSSATNINA